jgi:hypothetical protein
MKKQIRFTIEAARQESLKARNGEPTEAYILEWIGLSP